MDMMLRQNSFKFHEQLFSCEDSRMLLHKQSRIKGLLSLHASLVCPITEKRQDSMEIKDVNKEDIASKPQVNAEELQLKEETDRNKAHGQ